MANTVDKVISIANGEVGYLEKKTNASLDNKTANAGYNNWTKYGRDLVKKIGSPYANGVAWCDMFVDWCFIQAYGLNTAKTMLGGWSAYTPTSAQYFKNQGRYYTSKPQIGDQIFFKNTSGTICHTGIVYNVDSSYVYTIEGNTSGASGVVANGGGVCKKKYALSYNRIAGYGRPDYDKVSTNTPVTKMNSVDYSLVYNGDYYYNKYPDLQKAFGKNYSSLLNHFITYGMKEGRQAIASFNVQIYKNNYKDLQNAFGSDLTKYYTHYINHGKKEGRNAVSNISTATNTSAKTTSTTTNPSTNKTTTTTNTATSTSKKVETAQSYLKSLSGTYSVTASALNLRYGAGTSKGVVVSMPKGSKVTCYGYYTTVSGTKWLYIAYDKYTGYASASYLKKV